MTPRDADMLRWQAMTKRLCLYMGIVPLTVLLMLRRGMEPLLILGVAGAALLLFMTFVVWTYAKL